MKTGAFRKRRGGFTLVEILITVAISTSMIVALLSVYLTCVRSWYRTALVISTTREINYCLERMVYGVGTGMGLRASYSVTNLGSATDWLLRSSNASGLAWYDFNPGQTTIVYSNAAGRQVIGTNIIGSTVATDGNGVSIALTVLKTDGMLSGSNTMSTFVKLRTASMR
jgi:type II secretory pathway pseudopilin PulG